MSLLLIFEMIQQAALVKFMYFLSISKISEKRHFEHYEREIDSPCSLFFFFLKSHKAFRIAPCKQSWLNFVKTRLNFDLSFEFKSSGTVLLEIIVSSNNPIPQENTHPAPLETSTAALVCIFSSILNCS